MNDRRKAEGEPRPQRFQRGDIVFCWLDLAEGNWKLEGRTGDTEDPHQVDWAASKEAAKVVVIARHDHSDGVLSEDVLYGVFVSECDHRLQGLETEMLLDNCEATWMGAIEAAVENQRGVAGRALVTAAELDAHLARSGPGCGARGPSG